VKKRNIRNVGISDFSGERGLSRNTGSSSKRPTRYSSTYLSCLMVNLATRDEKWHKLKIRYIFINLLLVSPLLIKSQLSIIYCIKGTVVQNSYTVSFSTPSVTVSTSPPRRYLSLSPILLPAFSHRSRYSFRLCSQSEFSAGQ